jgi:RHS repeat-associated protein
VIYFDAEGRAVVVNSGTSFSQAAQNTFEYNDRREAVGSHRFLGADPENPGTEITAQRRGYAYDAIGNRKSHTHGLWAPVIYGTHPLNQYPTIGGTSLSYDEDGNLKTMGQQAFQWDGENRLVLFEELDGAEGTRVEFRYDYRGRRVEVKSWFVYEEKGEPGADLLRHEKYLWDDWSLLLVLDANNNPVQKFTWGLDIAEHARGLPRGGRPGAAAGGVGGLLGASTSQGGGAVDHLFFYDGNGNVGQLLDWTSGQTVAHYEYDPFGNIVASTGSRAAVNRFRFSTKYQDHDTDLYYYGYRYYSPSMGRWLNRDPINENGFFAVMTLREEIPDPFFKWSLIADAVEPRLGPSLTNKRNNAFAKFAAQENGYAESRTFGPEEEKHLYSFVLNDGVNSIDPDGLRRGRWPWNPRQPPRPIEPGNPAPPIPGSPGDISDAGRRIMLACSQGGTPCPGDCIEFCSGMYPHSSLHAGRCQVDCASCFNR